jgi:NADH-quinone oxidoreductase subunit J
MDISSIPFYLFGSLAIVFALMTILQKNPVTSALSLVIVFLCMTGLYASLDAHLLAALQILVYAGAIMVLFIFVIMLVNADIPSLDLTRTGGFSKIFAMLFGIGFLVILIAVFHASKSPGPLQVGVFTSEAIHQAGGNTQVISELLFSDYILPFELTSVLLLGGIVASVAIAKRRAIKAAPDKGAEYGRNV